MTPRLPQRFELVRELGRGGMGAVYEAIDTETGGRVAIKTLPSTNPSAVARFKREFRALTDLHHPNLVTLGELFCEEGEWSFSMDLIPGENILDYIRGPAPVWEDEPLFGADRTASFGRIDISTRLSASRVPHTAGAMALSIDKVSGGGFDEAKLRDAFAQLTRGLRALHEAKKVHRDIKPPNIRVRDDGHLFVLDFGVVSELARNENLTGDENVLGTPAYMAPEQAAGGELGPPGDWYAVGVLLFEALTGLRPFEGSPLTVMVAKQTQVAPRADAFVDDIPQDLNELCAELLQLRPENRPGPERILKILRAEEESRTSRAESDFSTVRPAPLVGRKDQLTVLGNAFDEMLAGRAGAVLLEGGSGTGKTFLATRFLDRARKDHPKTVVISGRCYENEALPYNAWDGAIESLASYLARLGADEATAFLPLHAAPLAQTFPALLRVPVVEKLVARSSRKPDPQETRRRAFAALRDLLHRIALTFPLVVFLDDLQWADYDSVSVLAELLREPSPPPLLFLATCRPFADFPEAARALEQALPASTTRCPVSELPNAEAIELATELLSHTSPNLVANATAIAKEAGGHALFIAELARHTATLDHLPHEGLTVEGALVARVHQLPKEAAALLTVLALAARPLPESVAVAAADIPPDELPRTLAALRIGHLARGQRSDGIEWLETYHDRVRKAVTDELSHEGKRALFARLALALEKRPLADPNSLADFWLGAGDEERAGIHASAAAERACAALAFDRAAAFYAIALSRPSCTREERHALLVRRGETLVKAGRGEEAAAVFQAAIPTATSADDVLDLERRAGEQLLQTGNYERGVEVMKRVLARLEIQWPRGPLQIAFTLVVLILRIALRGGRFAERSEAEVSRRDAMRIDVCHELALALTMADAQRDFVFRLRHMQLARDIGDLRRVAIALTLHIPRRVLTAGSDTPRKQRALDKEIARVTQAVERVKDPAVQAEFELSAGTTLVLACRPREGCALLESAEAITREQCHGRTWHLVSAEVYSILGCYYMGSLAKLVRNQARSLEEATDRRDRYGRTLLRLGFPNFAWLVRDDPAAARRACEEAVRDANPRGYSLEHYWAFIARANTLLYEGDVHGALAVVDASWPPLRRSLFRLFPFARFETSEVRARVHLAAALIPGGDRKAQLASAQKYAVDIGRTRVAYGRPMAAYVKSAIAVATRPDERSVELLRIAIAGLDKASLGLHAVVGRRGLGRLLKGDEGEALEREAEELLARETVRAPETLCRTLGPGFERPGLRGLGGLT